MIGFTTKEWATWLSRGARPVPRRGVAALVSVLTVVFVLAPAGCGNYSNEDLEFMSAVPQREDVTIEVPRRGNLVTAGTAEAWKTTLDVTRGFNRTADAFLSLIEKVRSHYPTSRNANERIWGPFPAEKNPGWQIEFHMLKRLDVAVPRFEYRLIMIPPTGVVLPSGQPVTQIIGGSFDAAGGVRVGAGHLTVTLDEARLAGIAFPGLDKLRELTIDYQTRTWPRHVEMTILNLADAPADAPSADPISATYVYERAENGDGAMTFTFAANVVPETGVLETLMVESRWLGTGPGRSDTTVTGGDTPGGTATSLECWNETFMSTYLFQSWAPGMATGQPDSCIPRL